MLDMKVVVEQMDRMKRIYDKQWDNDKLSFKTAEYYKTKLSK